MTIDINKRSGGSTELPVAECIDGHMGTWRVRTDFQPVLDEQEKQTGVSFVEKEYPYKPSMQEVKDFIYGVINMQTDEKILTGFVWNNKPVWLSEENQKNFSEAQRVAQMTEGASLPVKFKHTEGYHTVLYFCGGIYQPVPECRLGGEGCFRLHTLRGNIEPSNGIRL